MPIEYHIRLDKEHVATSLARRRSLNHGGQWFIVLKALCVVPLGGLAIMLLLERSLGAFFGAAVFAGLTAIIVQSGRIGDWLTVRQVPTLDQDGLKLTVSLSEEGVHLRSSLADRKAAWSSILVAKRATDGWLLFEDSGNPRWLPDAATRSNPAEIEELLRRALGERVVVVAGQAPLGNSDPR